MKANRTLRFGGYTTLLVAAVIAIVVGVNLLVEKLPWRADMTFGRFYSLSEQTEKVLASLKDPLVVLELWEAGKEDAQVSELVRRYQSRSPHLEVRQVDPYRNPVELKRYEENGTPAAAGSLVLDSRGRYRVIRLEDMYEMRENEYGELVPTTFVAESALTNAIVSVTAPKDPAVYFLRSHGEKELPEPLVQRMRAAFYDLRELALSAAGAVPEDADIVVAVAPQQDLSPGEVGALLAFLRQNGGRLLIMMDLGAEPQPSIGSLLESYGLAVRPSLVMERAANRFLPNQPYVLIPNVGSHPITDPNRQSELPIIFPVSQLIDQLPAVRRTVSIQPLLASSEQAWAKVDLEDPNVEKGPRDREGPFVLAAAVTDTGEVGEKANRLVVLASSHFVFPPQSMGRLEENENLFLNCLGWLQDRPELISIRPRTVSANRYELTLSQLQFFGYAGITVLLIPLAIFTAGLATWLRRRHR